MAPPARSQSPERAWIGKPSSSGSSGSSGKEGAAKVASEVNRVYVVYMTCSGREASVYYAVLPQVRMSTSYRRTNASRLCQRNHGADDHDDRG